MLIFLDVPLSNLELNWIAKGRILQNNLNNIKKSNIFERDIKMVDIEYDTSFIHFLF